MFKYSFNNVCTLMDNSCFSFKKINSKDLLKDILYELDYYVNESWDNIKEHKRWHRVSLNNIKKYCPAILIRAGEETVYQLSLRGHARIFGFVKSNIFYIIAYDKNHSMYPMS